MRLDAMRLDVWLHRVRLFKTRALAGEAVARGRVRVVRANQTQRIRKAHWPLRVGDRVVFVRGGHIRELDVLGLPHRRGPAPEAQSCYCDAAAPD